MASTINVELTQPLRAYVDGQTEAGNFGTPGQYIRELIIEDRERRKERLEQHLLNALRDETDAIEIPDDIFESGDIVAYAASARR